MLEVLPQCSADYRNGNIVEGYASDGAFDAFQLRQRDVRCANNTLFQAAREAKQQGEAARLLGHNAPAKMELGFYDNRHTHMHEQPIRRQRGD